MTKCLPLGATNVSFDGVLTFFGLANLLGEGGATGLGCKLNDLMFLNLSGETGLEAATFSGEDSGVFCGEAFVGVVAPKSSLSLVDLVGVGQFPDDLVSRLGEFSTFSCSLISV